MIHIGDCRDVMRALIAESDLAYCAGVVDSDGTIGIKKSTYAMRVRGDCQAAIYSERISVKQVGPEAVDLLHRLFGGTRYMQDPSAKRGKSLHSWEVRDIKAANCLRMLIPYLRIKKAQAENCLALRILKEQSKRNRVAFGRGHIGSSARSPEMSLAMDASYVLAKELNRVGVG